jgi:hypothetical protein
MVDKFINKYIENSVKSNKGENITLQLSREFILNRSELSTLDETVENQNDKNLESNVITQEWTKSSISKRSDLSSDVTSVEKEPINKAKPLTKEQRKKQAVEQLAALKENQRKLEKLLIENDKLLEEQIKRINNIEQVQDKYVIL